MARTNKGLLIFQKTIIPEAAYIPWVFPEPAAPLRQDLDLPSAEEQRVDIQRLSLAGIKLRQLTVFEDMLV